MILDNTSSTLEEVAEAGASVEFENCIISSVLILFQILNIFWHSSLTSSYYFNSLKINGCQLSNCSIYDDDSELYDFNNTF